MSLTVFGNDNYEIFLCLLLESKSGSKNKRNKPTALRLTIKNYLESKGRRLLDFNSLLHRGQVL